jgi:hypothetical protein
MAVLVAAAPVAVAPLRALRGDHERTTCSVGREADRVYYDLIVLEALPG